MEYLGSQKEAFYPHQIASSFSSRIFEAIEDHGEIETVSVPLGHTTQRKNLDMAPGSGLLNVCIAAHHTIILPSSAPV